MSPTIDDLVLLRISSSQLTPRFPHPLLPSVPFLGRYLPSSPPSTMPDHHTPFQLVFEPLRYGVVPETSVPLVFYIVIAAFLALMGAPHVIRLLEATASSTQAWDIAPSIPEARSNDARLDKKKR